MSEEIKEEVVKKKGGKMPIIAVLVLVLGGGGFFMMKGKGKKEAPAIKLGAIEPLEEFVVNMAHSTAYLRTEVALQFADGFKKEELDHNLPAVRDAVLTVLTSKAPGQVQDLEGKKKLKHEIALAVNEVLESLAPVAEGDKKKKEAEDKKAADKHKDWDAAAGPVLKVYFTSFATQ